MPVLLEAARSNPKVAFVFVNSGEGPEAVKAFQDETKLILPNVWLDPKAALSEIYNLQGLPATLFFDAKGSLVKRHLGQISRKQLEEYLKNL
jgi:hypothetical protein